MGKLLPRRFRLKKKNEFKNIYNKGKSIANAYLVVYYLEKKEKENNKIGFAVAKKIGSAVVRNKIKRRMREAIKKYLPIIRTDYDLIFIARIKIKGISFNDVEKNMIALLNKAGLIKKEK